MLMFASESVLGRAYKSMNIHEREEPLSHIENRMMLHICPDSFIIPSEVSINCVFDHYYCNKTTSKRVTNATICKMCTLLNKRAQ